MKITNVFDAVRDGTYRDFIRFYDGNVDVIDKYSGLNLLQLTVACDSNLKDKIKIVEFLLKEGVDINFIEKDDLRNALHILYFNMTNTEPEYLNSITKILVEKGIDINARDRHGSIPLNYAITVVKNPTEDIMKTYQCLIENGSDYNSKNNYGKSCKDYAKEFFWRNELLSMMEGESNEETK